MIQTQILHLGLNSLEIVNSKCSNALKAAIPQRDPGPDRTRVTTVSTYSVAPGKCPFSVLSEMYVLHHCVVIFFWSSGIMECTCMLFTFETGVPLMR